MPRTALDRRAFLGASAAAAALTASRLSAEEADAEPSLDAIARSRGLTFGTATAPDELRDPGYADLIARECSAIVGENDFKWKHILRA